MDRACIADQDAILPPQEMFVAIPRAGHGVMVQFQTVPFRAFFPQRHDLRDLLAVEAALNA